MEKDYTDIVGNELKAIHDNSWEIASLKNRIKNLEAQISAIEEYMKYLHK